MLHEQRFFFHASKAIAFALSRVYGRLPFTGYLTNVIHPTFGGAAGETLACRVHSARGARELSLVAKWHGDGYCTHWLDARGASPTCVRHDAGRRGWRSPSGARGGSVGTLPVEQ